MCQCQLNQIPPLRYPTPTPSITPSKIPFCQVPKLSDPEGNAWNFDTLGKKPLLQRLFCLMSGSVVTTGKAKKGKTAKAKASKASAAGKAKAKAKATADPAVKLPDEQDVQSSTVAVSRGVRNKLWIDDCFRAANHVVKYLRSLPTLQKLPEEDFMKAKRELVRLSMQFAFRGELLLQTVKGGGKLHKRWSTLRPALQAFGAEFLLKVSSHKKFVGFQTFIFVVVWSDKGKLFVHAWQDMRKGSWRRRISLFRTSSAVA